MVASTACTLSVSTLESLKVLQIRTRRVFKLAQPPLYAFGGSHLFLD